MACASLFSCCVAFPLPPGPVWRHGGAAVVPASQGQARQSVNIEPPTGIPYIRAFPAVGERLEIEPPPPGGSATGICRQHPDCQQVAGLAGIAAVCRHEYRCRLESSCQRLYCLENEVIVACDWLMPPSEDYDRQANWSLIYDRQANWSLIPEWHTVWSLQPETATH